MTDPNGDLSKLLLDFQERIDRKLKDLSFIDDEAAVILFTTWERWQ